MTQSRIAVRARPAAVPAVKRQVSGVVMALTTSAVALATPQIGLPIAVIAREVAPVRPAAVASVHVQNVHE